MTPTIEIQNPPAGAIPVTVDQLLSLGFTQAEIDNGEKRGEIKHIGPWQICKSYKAIVEQLDFDKSKGYTITTAARFWPARTVSSPREAGYQLEGRIKFSGKSCRVFTSSILFQLPSGKLISCATLFLCHN